MTADDLAAAEERQGVRVESGDALVVRGDGSQPTILSAPCPPPR
ncbi:hypothetical protein ACQ4WX_50995 [Streptomyces lasalocidi]